MRDPGGEFLFWIIAGIGLLMFAVSVSGDIFMRSLRMRQSKKKQTKFK